MIQETWELVARVSQRSKFLKREVTYYKKLIKCQLPFKKGQ
jgi:hypothetical protein